MIMIKTYKAKTSISINVVLPGKKNMHVSFTNHSDGSSSFVTDNSDLQRAIEQHYKFGKLFRLVSSVSPETIAAKKVEEASEREAITVVKTTDLSSAKEYLAEKFGISRSRLRREEDIKAQAKAHGVVFEGI